MGPEFGKELTKANKSVAQFVADDARAAAYSIGGVAAKAAPSVKATAGAAWAGVALGGPSAPYTAGAEFGSVKFKQFKPWRGNGTDAGYFLFPVIRRDGDRIETEYTQALDDLLRKTGLS